jgi:hypothetical protein
MFGGVEGNTDQAAPLFGQSCTCPLQKLNPEFIGER